MFCFHPYLGKWSQLTNMFQLGWSTNKVAIVAYDAGLVLLYQLVVLQIGCLSCNRLINRSIGLQAGFLKGAYTQGPWCCSDGLRVSIYQNPQASRPRIVPQDILVLVSRVGFDSWLISNYEQTCAFSLLDLMTCLHFLDEPNCLCSFKTLCLVPCFVVSEKSKAWFNQG